MGYALPLTPLPQGSADRKARFHQRGFLWRQLQEVRGAPHAPSLRGGIPPGLLVVWEEEGRVPVGTVQIGRVLLRGS